MHTAQFHVTLGILAGLGSGAVVSLVFGGPLWDEDFALFMGRFFWRHTSKSTLFEESAAESCH